MLLESIRACHFPSARGCDSCAARHPAEVVSWLERAELWQREEKQGSGLAIYADFRCLPVCSRSSRQGCLGVEVAPCVQPRDLPIRTSICSRGSPGAAVLSRGFEM